jgi:hypothetical protein
MEAPRRNLMHGSHVAVVYRDSSLRAASLEVRDKVLVNLVAAVLPDRPAVAALVKLRPYKIVVGPEAAMLLKELGESAIFCPKRSRGSISVVVHLADAIVVIRCKRLVMDEIIGSWIEGVVEDGQDGLHAPADVA